MIGKKKTGRLLPAGGEEEIQRYNQIIPGAVPEQPDPAPFPAKAAPWVWILADNVAYNGDISRPIRYMHDAHLRNMAANLALMDITLPFTLAAWKLPQLDEPGFWAGTVLPQIRKELERRSRPPKIWDANSPIAKLKQLNIEDVAGKYTELTGSGSRLKGRCPLHKEKTASFYVYTDTQRWHCYGACVEGGDIVDLIRRLRHLGKSK